MQEDFLHEHPLLSSILSQTTDGVIVAGAHHEILYINQAALDITKWSLNDALVADLINVLNVRNEVYQSELAFIHKKTLLPPHIYTGHTLLLDKEGREVHLDIKVSTLVVPGSIKFWCYIFQNIDNERLKEYQVKETSRKYEKLFDLVTEAVLIFNDQGKIIEANPTACKLFEMPLNTLQHQEVKTFFTHKSSEEADLIWNDFLQYGTLEYSFKYTGQAKVKHLQLSAQSNFHHHLHVAVFKNLTRLKNLKRKSATHQMLLKSFTNNSSEPFIYLNKKLKIEATNTAATNMALQYCGVSLTEGANACDALPDEITAKFKQFFNKLSDTEILEEALLLDQSIIHCRIKNVLVHNKSKGILIFFGVSAMPALHTNHTALPLPSVLNEGYFRNLAESSPDIIYIINLKERRVTYFNRDYIFGYPSHELEHTEGWIKMVHPADIQKVKSHWAKFLKKPLGTVSIEYRLQRKDNEYEWVINRHTVIERDNSGMPVSVLLYITVITERRRMDEALRESEARLMALIENTNDILWSVDKDFSITALNSSFKKIFKLYYKKEIEVGNNLYEVLPARANLEWLQNHKRALGGERFTTEFNITGKHSGFYEVSYNPIFNEEGQVNGVSVFGRDITLRKTAENDIVRTNFELDSFVYRASHDLRAPLRSVLGLINIVKTEENPQQRNMYLNLVDKSINKLDTFIADLTNFSRNSRLEVSVEKINFNNIISDCIDNLKYMENADIIDTRIVVNEKYEFWSDPGRIIIILQNLLSNAIKYRNPNNDNCYVIIKVETLKNQCLITMTDNGKGIKEEYLEKVFNMFFRASHDSYGSGLGLYITKQVVEKLTGSISVSSSLGKGSTFEIKLPNLLKQN